MLYIDVQHIQEGTWETIIGIYAKININIINNPEKTMQKNQKKQEKKIKKNQ